LPAQVVRRAEWDFGGTQIAGVGRNVVSGLGKVFPRDDTWSISNFFGIGEAQALAGPVGSCHQDSAAKYRPNDVKSLSTDQARQQSRTTNAGAVKDFYPGLYKTAWSTPMQTHLVALNGLSIRKTGEIENVSTFQVYKDHAMKSAAEAKTHQPEMRVGGEAIAFRGEKGLLYRHFFPKGGQLRCLDVLFPNSATGRTIDTQLVYTRDDKLYAAPGKFEAVKLQ
jgi:hypothetical protein